MKIKPIILATATALILAPALAVAKDHDKHQAIQYTGPVDLVSLSTLLDDTSYFADKEVIVDGYLVRRLRKDDFIFSDGQKEIQVELDDDIQLDQSLDAKTKVRLFGEYENGKTPEIEVDHIQIL